MTEAPELAHQTRFFRDFLRLAGPFWLRGPQRWSARFWTATMALLDTNAANLRITTYDTASERTGITGLLNDLGEAGIRFNDLNTTQSSLEEIFVSLVHRP